MLPLRRGRTVRAAILLCRGVGLIWGAAEVAASVACASIVGIGRSLQRGPVGGPHARPATVPLLMAGLKRLATLSAYLSHLASTSAISSYCDGRQTYTSTPATSSSAFNHA